MHPFQKAVDVLVIQGCLFSREVYIGFHLIFVRKIELDRRVFFLAAQHERLNHLLQIRRPLRIPLLLNGICEPVLKGFGAAEVPGGDEIID
ncbi:hypothetical protein D3C75_909430 [compost metagenome]